MNIAELDYDLPEKLIAQTPIEPRDSSKLLVINRSNENISHKTFTDITDYLLPNDLLVVNNTKVLPARLRGKKQDTGAKIEVLLLTPHTSHLTPHPTWEVLAKPAKRLKRGTIIAFGQDLKAEILDELEDGRRLIKFSSQEPLLDVLQKVGEVPLPPYISTPLQKPERYQTIYAQKEESAAAPTAGLHFTPQLINKIKTAGIKFAHVTLRIGLDTFQPIREDTVEKHRIHSEYFEVGKEAATLLNQARANKSRIIAVGTTSARVLESAINKNGTFDEISGFTDLFICPPYQFKAVNCLITNFHLPRTTLLAMVSTFTGLDLIKKSYAEAINNKYRFFSFGDAMLII